MQRCIFSSVFVLRSPAAAPPTPLTLGGLSARRERVRAITHRGAVDRRVERAVRAVSSQVRVVASLQRDLEQARRRSLIQLPGLRTVVTYDTTALFSRWYVTRPQPFLVDFGARGVHALSHMRCQRATLPRVARLQFGACSRCACMPWHARAASAGRRSVLRDRAQRVRATRSAGSPRPHAGRCPVASPVDTWCHCGGLSCSKLSQHSNQSRRGRGVIVDIRRRCRAGQALRAVRAATALRGAHPPVQSGCAARLARKWLTRRHRVRTQFWASPLVAAGAPELSDRWHRWLSAWKHPARRCAQPDSTPSRVPRWHGLQRFVRKTCAVTLNRHAV